MAEFNSAQYTAAFTATTPSPIRYRNGGVPERFDYTQVATGTAGDTINLIKVPPHGMVVMWESYFRFIGWTSGATLSLGWRAYTDENGVVQPASAAGLLSAVSLTVDGAWAHGMLVVATPDDSIPVVDYKIFDNRTEVVLFATIGAQAPGAGDILNGSFMVYRM